MGPTKRDDAREAEKGVRGCWHIARKRLESLYSWDTEGERKMKAFGIEDK